MKRRVAIIGSMLLAAFPVVKRQGLRFSTDPDNNIGYANWMKYKKDYDIKVFVNGKEIEGVRESDEDRSYAISYIYDDDGYIIVYDNHAPEIMHRGKITYALEPLKYRVGDTL